MNELYFHYRVAPLIGTRHIAIADERMRREVCRYAAVQLGGVEPVSIRVVTVGNKRAHVLASFLAAGLWQLGEQANFLYCRQGAQRMWDRGDSRLVIGPHGFVIGQRFSWVLVDGVGDAALLSQCHAEIWPTTESIVYVSAQREATVPKEWWIGD